MCEENIESPFSWNLKDLYFQAQVMIGYHVITQLIIINIPQEAEGK